jgi:hypothetical protein
MEAPPTKKRHAISDLPEEPLAKRPKIEKPSKPKRAGLDVLLGR